MIAVSGWNGLPQKAGDPPGGIGPGVGLALGYWDQKFSIDAFAIPPA